MTRRSLGPSADQTTPRGTLFPHGYALPTAVEAFSAQGPGSTLLPVLIARPIAISGAVNMMASDGVSEGVGLGVVALVVGERLRMDGNRIGAASLPG